MTSQLFFPLHHVHPSWQYCIERALANMNPAYLYQLKENSHWLPGPHAIFNAFSLPLDKVHYVLLGESPYPRSQSANGYAFWDASVDNLWSKDGMSTKVNRATSLRNIIKMLLVAEGLLSSPHTTQPDIARIDKTTLVTTNHDLFHRFLDKGFLLLNASLVLQDTSVNKDAKAWQPFIREILIFLHQHRPHTLLLLWGRIAHEIKKIMEPLPFPHIISEHPYNHSFIQNQDILHFFNGLHLIRPE